jgi:hypothetical protein
MEREEYIRALKKAIKREDEEVLRILEDAIYSRELEFFKEKVFPAMIHNKSVSAWGWEASRNVNEYLRRIDTILGEKGAGLEALIKDVEKHVEDYYDEEDIEYMKENYIDWRRASAEFIVDEFIRGNELSGVVDIISDIIEGEMKKRGITIEEVFDNMIPPYTHYEELEAYIENEDYDRLLDIVEDAGLMGDLHKVLEKYMGR